MKVPRSLARRAKGASVDSRGTGRELPIDVEFGPGSAALLDTVQPYTLTSVERIFALRDAVRYIVEHGIPGALIECGVWRGGSAMVMIETLRQLGAARPVVLFDTFSGMTPPTEVDRDLHGVSATELLGDSDNDSPYWARAGLAEVMTNLAMIDYPSELITFVQGRVEDTLPRHAPQGIALCRLDTDWYESTIHELQHLYPRLARRGVLIVDDYGHFQGAKRAVDEYFETLDEAPLLVRIDYTGRLAVKP